MLHRLLERLDEAASTLVPLLYLAGLMLGATAYFAGVTLDAGLAVGVALAAAAELHSFLQQRRLRATWAHFQRLPDDAPEREQVWQRVQVNAAILAALLAFSAFNAIAFAAETWRPAPGFLPPWLQIGLRGLVIPVFFFLAGFLSPLTTDANDQLRATSSEMLRRTLRAIGKQWQARLKAAQRRNADLAPVAVALLLDVGDADGARRVELIAAGLAASEGRQSHHTATQEGQQTALPGEADTLDLPTGDDEPPTGPGRPSHAPAVASKPRAGNVTPISRRGMGRPPRRDKRSASRANARSGRRGKAEQRIRAALDAEPGITPEQLATRAGVSSSTVSKWLAVIEAERRASRDALAQ
ncbi:MAG TPA: helix-turn-helix transcriptional regulator [Ktedonobacterales bacterium]|jgi:hypothetical protein|nr:helix-turn-helix transcriptional regulator [Ktedonobacterales bacterium]